MSKDLLKRFENHLQVLNRSPATIDIYLLHTRLFLNAVGIKKVKQTTTFHIEQWIGGLLRYRSYDGRPYSTSTICTKIRSVKRFFEFLEKENIIFIDPAESIKEPKSNLKINTFLTEYEIKLILKQPDLRTAIGIRDRAILEVFYSTGIRSNEMKSLGMYDIDVHAKTLRVRKGKGLKDRVVPIGSHAIKYLKVYLSKVRPKLNIHNAAQTRLFLNMQGKPLTRQVIGIIVKTHSKSAGIYKKVTAHTLRHSFATLMVKNGADLVSVQKILGHENIRTTQLYIRSLIPDVKIIHKKTHPREHDAEEVRKFKNEPVY